MAGRLSQLKKKQYEIKFRIANICILMLIKSPRIKKRVESHYRKFISEAKPDLFIDVEHENFIKPKFEQLLFETRSWNLGRQDGSLFLYFPGRNRASLARFNAQLNRIKFYTQDPSGQLLLYLFPEILFSLILPKYQALMLHACGVMDGKKGYLFIASAGGGKSTIAKLADKEGLTILNDDRIIVVRENNHFKMYGNPWHGEVGKTSNKSLYIQEIFFLKKFKSNQIKAISKAEATAEFFKNSFCLPVNNDIIKKRFNICANLAEDLNCYQFGFKPDKFIWRFLDGYVKKNS